MKVTISKVEQGYVADVTLSTAGTSEEQTVGPLSRDELIDALYSLGFYQQDIGDAFFEGDPEWLSPR